MNPTHTLPETAPVEPTTADILRGAALYLKRHGWIQRAYYPDTWGGFDPATQTHYLDPTPPACAVGALAMAAYGKRVEEPHATTQPEWRQFAAAEAFLNDYLDLTTPEDTVDNDPEATLDVLRWNDNLNRTAEEVIATLNSAADEYERTHTGGAR